MNPNPAMNPLYVDKKVHVVHMHLNNGVQIRGSLHVAPRVRLTDTLNFQAGDKPFIPVTDVQIITPSGKEISTPYMVVNRNNIISCVPQEKIKGELL